MSNASKPSRPTGRCRLRAGSGRDRDHVSGRDLGEHGFALGLVQNDRDKGRAVEDHAPSRPKPRRASSSARVHRPTTLTARQVRPDLLLQHQDDACTPIFRRRGEEEAGAPLAQRRADGTGLGFAGQGGDLGRPGAQ